MNDAYREELARLDVTLNRLRIGSETARKMLSGVDDTIRPATVAAWVEGWADEVDTVLGLLYDSKEALERLAEAS